MSVVARRSTKDMDNGNSSQKDDVGEGFKRTSQL